jgi:metallo-beta-lactamase class B
MVTLRTAVILFCAGSLLRAQYHPADAPWNRPVAPFRVAGNLYYVGASGVSAYLFTTPDGYVLPDAMRALPCDIFLATHSWDFDLPRKMEALKSGGANPFVDPAGYARYLDRAEAALRKALAAQGLSVH